jgi:hypothetical protein
VLGKNNHMLNKRQLFMVALLLMPGSLFAIDGFYMDVGTGVNKRSDSAIVEGEELYLNSGISVR